MFSFYVLLSLEFLDVICICRVALTEIYLGTHPYYCHPSGLTLSPCLALCHIYLRANAFLPRMAEDKYIAELWLLTTSRALETLALHPNILSHAISKQSYISLCLLVGCCFAFIPSLQNDDGDGHHPLYAAPAKAKICVTLGRVSLFSIASKAFFKRTIILTNVSHTHLLRKSIRRARRKLFPQTNLIHSHG